MKKSIFIFAGIVALAFSSCKKDYTCVCREDTSGTVVSTSTIHTKKSLSSSTCSLNDTYLTTCTIE